MSELCTLTPLTLPHLSSFTWCPMSFNESDATQDNKGGRKGTNILSPYHGLSLDELEQMDHETLQPTYCPEYTESNGDLEGRPRANYWNDNDNLYFEQALDSFMVDVAGGNDSSSVLNRKNNTQNTTPTQEDVASTTLSTTPTTGPLKVEQQQQESAKAGVTSGVRSTRPSRTRSRKRRRSSTEGASKPRSKKLSSAYRGVSKCSKDGRWQARIRIGAVVKYLGRFKSEVEAAHCYDVAAHRYHKERAMPNFDANGNRTFRNNQDTSSVSSDSDIGSKTE